jgi:hypothetical protein
MLAFPLSHDLVDQILWVLALAVRSMAVFVHVRENIVDVDFATCFDIVARIYQYSA